MACESDCIVAGFPSPPALHSLWQASSRYCGHVDRPFPIAGMAPATSQQPWWELEPIPKRRTELPETKARMPTMQELYRAVKHGMTVRN